MKRLFVVALMLVFQAAQADNPVEFSLEVGEKFEKGYSRVVNEHWPATIDILLYLGNSPMRDCVSIAFSLSREEAIHERLRIGLATEIEKPVFDEQRQKLVRDGRVYFYAKSENQFGIWHLYYPVAKDHNGEKWYWRLVVEDISLRVARGNKWSCYLTTTLDYGPEYGLKDSYGLKIEKGDLSAIIANDQFSLRLTSSTGF